MLSRRFAVTVLFGYFATYYNSNVLAQEVTNTVTLEEITVTANKRPQSLEKVDGGISVVTSQQLRENDVRTVEDLKKVFPGLTIDNRGNSAYANITSRGLSSPDYYNPAVQVYVDGVPQAASVLSQTLGDVERVEFLRGPQGTLYGRGALGGVINIISKAPREQTVTVDATASNRLFGIGAVATGVVVPDTLFVDVAIKETHRLGQITDVDRDNENIDGWNDLRGRLGLRYAPAAGPFDASAWVSHDYLRSREETFILDQDVKARKYRSSLFGGYNLLNRETTTGALSWNYRFGDFTISNTSSYQHITLKRLLFGSHFPETDSLFNQELKLAYVSASLKGVAGLSYSNDWFTRDADGYPGFYGSSKNKVESRSSAAFGELTYSLTSALDITAGARANYDWASIDYNRPDVFANGYGFSFDNTADFTGIQPKVSLGYQVSDATRVYALVSQGYKAGGFNHAVSTPLDAVSYQPETALNYEVGGKAELFGGILKISSAVYYIESSDKQIYVGAVANQVIRNAGKGESYGIESEATFLPTDNLTLTLSGHLGRSTFVDMTDPLSGITYSGKAVPYAPNATANLSARYVLNQSLLPGEVAVTGAAHLTSKVYFDPANTLSQAGYATFDAGIEFVPENGPKFRVFVDNIADTAYRTSSFDYSPAVISTVGEGRLVGISISKRF